MSDAILYVCSLNSALTTEEQLARCADDYLQQKPGTIPCDAVTRSAYGKPSLTEYPVECSVSHTGEIFAAVLQSKEAGPVGLDIQAERPVDCLKIAKRFFQEEEYLYVVKTGPAGFYRVWTRKEALTKYLGLPLGQTLSKYSVASPEGLHEQVGGVQFIDFEISSGISASIAVKAGCTVNLCRREMNEKQY